MHKIKKIFLTIHIKQLLTKNKILKLYLNKIYLNYHTYNINTTTQIYFKKTINQLTLNKITIITKLPKTPSTFNPLYSINHTITQHNIILSQILNKKYITQQQFNQTHTKTINTNYHTPKITFSTPYLNKIIHQKIYNHYNKNTYKNNYHIYTTITHKIQQTTQQTIHNNILNYNIHHNYHNPTNIL